MLYMLVKYLKRKMKQSAYNSYTLAKGFEVLKGKTTKSKTDGKIIRRQFVYNKKVIKSVTKGKRDMTCYFHEIPTATVKKELKQS